jgi:hypothetical protein
MGLQTRIIFSCSDSFEFHFTISFAELNKKKIGKKPEITNTMVQVPHF